jgi:hypothetical protein
VDQGGRDCMAKKGYALVRKDQAEQARAECDVSPPASYNTVYGRWWRQYWPRTAACNSLAWSRRSYGVVSVPSTHRYFQMKKVPDIGPFCARPPQD